MAGRPPRDVEVEVVFLRLPKDVVERVTKVKGWLETQGHKLNTTQAYCRILEAGCAVLEGTREDSKTPVPAQMELSEIAAISSMPIAKIAAISGDDVSVPGYGFPEDEDEEETSVSLPAVTQPAPASHRNGQRASAMSARAIPLETLQAIADAAAEYDKLSFAQLAQLLYERNIYRAKDPVTGQEKPLNKGTLKKWIERARAAGLL